jgi:hypothetical protein
MIHHAREGSPSHINRHQGSAVMDTAKWGHPVAWANENCSKKQLSTTDLFIITPRVVSTRLQQKKKNPQQAGKSSTLDPINKKS